MKVRVGYVEEPPFYSTGSDGSATGSDIELAEVILKSIGATTIEFVATTFGELLPGVVESRWDMNVPIFVTDDRASKVAFSLPVWSLVDGFVVRSGNPKALTGYDSMASNREAILGVIPGQVQVEAARTAGIAEEQLRKFDTQPSAVRALLAGEIDAFVATAVGNQSIVDANPALESIRFRNGSGNAPSGAFSFSQANVVLRSAVNDALRNYLGTADHRKRMSRYGIGAAEIDGAIRAAR